MKRIKKEDIKNSIRRIKAEGGNIGGAYALRVLRLALKAMAMFVLVFMAVHAFADDLTPTAAVTPNPLVAFFSAVQPTGEFSWSTLLHFLLSAAVGFMSYAAVQNMLKVVIASSPNLLVRFGAPFFLNTIMATVGFFATKQWGITPADATTAAAVSWAAFEYLQGQGLGAVLKEGEVLVTKGLSAAASSSLAPQAVTLLTNTLVAAGHPEAAALIAPVVAAYTKAQTNASAAATVAALPASAPKAAAVVVQAAVPPLPGSGPA